MRQKPLVPFWQLFLMFFIAFSGLLMPTWIFFMCCGYPQWSVGSVPITASNVMRGIQSISVLFFGYIVIRRLMMEGFKGFPGISIPLALLLVALFVRQVFDYWYLLDHFWVRVLELLSFNILLLAFAIRYDSETLNKATRYGIFIPMLVLAGIMLFTWSNHFVEGTTMRSREFQTEWINLAPSIVAPRLDKESRYMRPPHHLVLMTGSIIGLSALSLLRSGKSLYFFSLFPIHACGTSLIVFTGYRSWFTGYVCACLFVLTIHLLHRLKENGISKATLKTFASVFVIVAMNVFLVYNIGFKDRDSLIRRFQEFSANISDYQADVQALSRQQMDFIDIKPEIRDDKSEEIIDTSETKANESETTALVASGSAEQRTAATDNSGTENGTATAPVATDTSEETGLQDKRSLLYKDLYALSKSIKLRNRVPKHDYIILSKDLGVKDPRLIQYKLAMLQIRQYPILGYSTIFVVDLRGEPVYFPLHCNVLIIFSAIGIFGGLLFLYIVFTAFIDAVRIIVYDMRLAWIPALFIYQFTASLLEPIILQSVYFFVPLVLMHSVVKLQSLKNPVKENTLAGVVE